MHEVRLAPCQELHLVDGFAVDLTAMQGWRAQAMDDPVSVLILSLLEVPLDHFGIVGLQAVWLDLEAFVYFLHVLNVILNCLSSLLLDGQVGQAAAKG